MFQIYHSNQLDVLKDLLVHFIQQEPLANPFEEEQILVQSPGMAQWLKLALAEDLGIAANINFPLPASFIWQMFINYLDDIPERSAFNKDGMAWKIMKILPELLSKDEFSPLQQYLQEDAKQHKTYQLSNKIADIFDQYLVYRPEWIDDWEKGGNKAAEQQHGWQPILWRALVAETEELGQSHWHRANLYEGFIKKLQQSHKPKGLPKRIFVFGVSALPPRYLQALQALGQHTDVHFMLSNPCRYYWGDILDQKWLAKLNARRGLTSGKTSDIAKQNSLFDAEGVLTQGNPLLASMGKLGRDNLFLLADMGMSEIDAFVSIEGSSLLQQIQKDILELEDASQVTRDLNAEESSQYKQRIGREDNSISLHLCHSPMREVEVLHDQILNMLQQDPALTPKDIVVMMPDVNAYSPYIQTVFGSASGEHYIPFAISDRSAQQENPLLNSFLQLLQLPLSRFKQSDLMGILEVPEVLARFKLDVDELPLISHWIEESGIRWGLDEQDKDRFDLQVMPQNTWLAGLKRLLLGYSMASQQPYQGLLPYDAMAPANASCLGKLAHFVEALQNLLQQIQQPRPLKDWIELINQLLEDFYLVDVDGEYVLKLIRDGLQSLQHQIDDAGFDLPINNELIHSYLNNRLQSQRSSQRFLAGQLNFCTLMPMRSIPFKVVCLLGMNDDVYPRSIAPLGFDLMNGQTKKGDRSRRDDDRYLFLEAIVSAQKILYISYTGFDIQDNSEKLPSVLVTELLEYIGASRVLEGDENLKSDKSAKQLVQKLSCKHSLQAFNSGYFQKNSRLFSYNSHWLPALNADPQVWTDRHFVEEPLAPIAFSQQQEIELDSIKRFLINPSAYFMRQRLKVNFSQDGILLQDDEPFVLDGLDNYLLQDRLLETWLKDDSTELLQQQLASSGKLPQGYFGQLMLDEKSESMQQLKQRMQHHRQDPQDNIDINIALTINQQEVRLVGWLAGHYQQGLVRYKATKFNAKDYLKHWLDYLCYCIQVPGALPMQMFDADDHYQFEPLPAEQALLVLQDILQCYVDGLNKPLAFFVRSAWKYWQALDQNSNSSPDDNSHNKNDEEDEAFKEAQATFEGGFNFTGEGQDPYIHRCFADFSQTREDFIQITQALLRPLSVQLKKVEKASE